MLLGVNYSHRQAAWLGLDPEETLYELVNRLRVRRFRLSLYWGEIQPEPTRYDFAEVHRQLDLLEARGCSVLLTVGLKAQRHPEFYPPAWLLGPGLPAHGGSLAESPRTVAHLLLMLERVVALLADYRCIEAWQVENEPFQPAAGRTIGWRIDPETLVKEIAVVMGSDPRHRPIVINHSSNSLWEPGWMRALRLADVLAQDVYTRKPAGPARYFNPFSLGPFGPGLLVQSILAKWFGRGFWVTELQAEPWEHTPLTDLARDEVRSISPEQIVGNLALVRRAGAQRAYLWGAEWWLQQRALGDPRYWALAEELFAGQA